jgi:hypothetical protein
MEGEEKGRDSGGEGKVKMKRRDGKGREGKGREGKAKRREGMVKVKGREGQEKEGEGNQQQKVRNNQLSLGMYDFVC